LGIHPNPQSPIPNPQSPIPIIISFLNKKNYFNKIIIKQSSIDLFYNNNKIKLNSFNDK